METEKLRITFARRLNGFAYVNAFRDYIRFRTIAFVRLLAENTLKLCMVPSSMFYRENMHGAEQYTWRDNAVSSLELDELKNIFA